MTRNPRPPISYHKNPKKRSEEKLFKTIELLVKFRFSTKKLMLINLDLAVHSHHRYFAKLESQGILKKVDLYSIRGKSIYILGQTGEELANKLFETTHSFSINPLRLNYVNIRHDLSVQKAILDRAKDCKYKSEHEIKPDNLTYYKIPDAILLEKKGITAVEVELTAKSDKRIYQAFFDHCQNIIKNNYKYVIFIFHSSSLKENYISKFLSEKWLTYKKSNQNRLIVSSCFDEKLSSTFKNNFFFSYDKEILNFW